MSDGFGGLVRRPRLNDRTGAKITQAKPQAATAQKQLTQAEWAARRSRRSEHLLEALKQIDVAPSIGAQREIVEWLREVYEKRGGGTLVGLFGHCYLGHPYIDHAFDMSGAIMRHYTPGEAVPLVYVGARPFAVSDAYSYIEIYADGQIVPIRPDGTPAI